jgi:hypothetical protein
MEDRTSALHAAIVPATDDLSLMDEHRTDRNAPFREPGFRLGDGHCHVWVH